MRLKLDIAALRPGMYVSELDRPWTETPFLFQGIAIESYSQIEDLQRYCDYVFVDQAPPAAAAQRRAEIDLFKNSARRALANPEHGTSAAFEQELRRVRAAFPALLGALEEAWRAQRLHKDLPVSALQHIATEVVASVLRNPDALLYLAVLAEKFEDAVRHSMRTAILTASLGRVRGLDTVRLQPLTLAALLHDIGQTELPLELLAKTEALTAAEAVVLASHVERGVKLLSHARDLPPEVLRIALLHHERADGSGYPRRTSQAADSGALMVALTDEYDTLCRPQPGRAAVSPHLALLHLYGLRGTAFDGALVEALTQCIGIYPVGSIVELNTGHVGVVAALNRERYLRPRVMLVLDDQQQRYNAARPVDLARQARDEHAQSWEIKTVWAPGTFGIRAEEVLPLA